MFELRVNQADLAKLRADLAALEGQALKRQIANAVSDDALLPALRDYPAPSGRPQPFKTERSRRFFFAALRRGQITVPYPRTGELGRSWAQVGDGFLVASTAAHSELVMGEHQAAYHRGTWKNVAEIADQVEGGPAQGIAERAVQRFIDARGLG